MSKQSSVDWLIKKLQNRQNGIFDGFPHLSLDEIYEQAKAMHEHEVKDAYIAGNNVNEGRNPEQYYKDTFA